MPELTFEQLPEVLKENQRITSEINQLVKRYLQHYHPNGWNLIDGAKHWIENTHRFIQAPIKDSTLGGFIYYKSNRWICFINSWQPRAYQNFILMHELYHILSAAPIQERGPHYIEPGLDSNIAERKADYFASILLMDEQELKTFYQSLGKVSISKRIFLTMKRFSAPYKAVLIRL